MQVPGLSVQPSGADHYPARPPHPPSLIGVDRPAERGVVRDLIAFVRGPRADWPATRRSRPVALLKLLLIDYLLVLPLLFVAVGAAALADAEQDLSQEELTPVLLVLALVVFAPIIEELTFRLPLTTYRPIFLLISGVLMAGFFGLPPRLDVASLLALVPGVLLAALAVMTMLSAQLRDRVAAFWDRRFAIVFFTPALLFGLAHLANYSFSGFGALQVLAGPGLVAPQIVGGIVLGYARIRLGLLWAMGLHAAYNGLLAPLILLAE